MPGEATATDWAAWIGAITGVAALGFQAYQHWTTGPKVELSLNPHMRVFPAIAPEDDAVYVVVTATNNGTAKTTITHLSVCTYSYWWKVWLDIPDQRQGIIVARHRYASPIPHVLEFGEMWTGMIANNDALREMSLAGYLYCRVFHSGRKRPARARISLE